MGRSRSAEDGSFFFEPFQLHFEPADLLEQLGLAGLGVGRAALGPVGEHRPGPGQQLLLPAVDQVGWTPKWLASSLTVRGPCTAAAERSGP